MIKANINMLKLWEMLEEEKNSGLRKRLYSGDIPFRIYCTFRYPERRCGIAFTFSNAIQIDISSFVNLSDLNVISWTDTTSAKSNLLIVELLNLNSRDIFATLCESLMRSVIKLDSEKSVSRIVVNQLEKWKNLFEKKNSKKCLTSAEQQGLYGELHFLQKFLSKSSINYCDILDTWIGVDRELHDFQGRNWAIEVKTTSTNNPQKVAINGERQLDETLLKDLFLFHLSVEVSKSGGQTICQKVAVIRKMIEDEMALSLFSAKLFEIGYYPDSEQLYQNRSYQIRNENFYRIENNFPRIKENELRRGISDVKYSIVPAMCDEYSISENHIFDVINAL